MELPQVKTIEEIVKRINCNDRTKKIEIAKEINELSKILIELYRSEKCQQQ